MRTTLLSLATAALVLTAGLACGDEDPFAPYQPQIHNNPDNFEFQVTGLTGLTVTKTYVWQNTGSTATVNHSSAVSGGSTLLVIRNPAGTEVYSAPLVASGTVVTGSGAAGAWTIRVELTNTAGTLNFRVQKTP